MLIAILYDLSASFTNWSKHGNPLTGNPLLYVSTMATVVLGAQWGDEGKGKLTDILCAQASLCARAQGGNNAGQ